MIEPNSSCESVSETPVFRPFKRIYPTTQKIMLAYNKLDYYKLV